MDVSVTLESNAARPRSLPKEFRCPAAEKLFVEGAAAMHGEFVLSNSGRPLAREVAVLLMRALTAARGLTLKAERIDCDDPSVIAHQLTARLADLPIRPSAKLGTLLVLRTDNSTNHTRVVTPHEFELPRGWPVHPFPTRCELFNLAPGRRVLIEAKIVEAFAPSAGDPELPGEEPGNPGGLLAYAVAATPEGVGAANPLTVVPPRMRLAFDTHGFVTPLDVLRRVLTDVVDKFRKLSFDRLAVERSDPLTAVYSRRVSLPIFSAPLGYDAPPGAPLLLARLVFLTHSEYVAPGTDHREEQIIRLAAADREQALSQLVAARADAVKVLEGVLQQLTQL